MKAIRNVLVTALAAAGLAAAGGAWAQQHGGHSGGGHWGGHSGGHWSGHSGGHWGGGHWGGGHWRGGWGPSWSFYFGVPLFWGPYYWGAPYSWGPAYYYDYGYPYSYSYPAQVYPDVAPAPAEELPPTTQVPSDKEGTPSRGPLYMNYCASAKAYFPKVTKCPEGWKFIAPN